MRRLFDVNVYGTFELTQALLPLLIKSKGMIINNTTQSPHVMPVFCGAYAVSEAALVALTNTLKYNCIRLVCASSSL